jgi:hypothetical protein
VLCTGTFTGTCRLGVQLPLLLLAVGNQFSVAVPPQPGLVGARLALQGLDFGATSCPASLLGFAFAVTDTVLMTVR